MSQNGVSELCLHLRLFLESHNLGYTIAWCQRKFPEVIPWMTTKQHGAHLEFSKNDIITILGDKIP
jgi:hypothetical protein